MTDSIHKKVVDAVASALRAIAGKVTVEINTALPQEVPEDGLIIVRDAVAEPTEEMLGGFDTLYVVASIPVEVFVMSAVPSERDRKYDELLQAVGSALLQRDASGQRSLGGLIYGLMLDRPEALTQDILGADAVKAASIRVRVEYEAPSAL